MVETVPKSDLDRVAAERDQLRDTLKEERSRHRGEWSKLHAEIEEWKEHDALAARGWASVYSAQAELTLLKEKAARSSARDKAKIEKTVAETRAKLSAVEDALRKVPKTVGPEWSDFKRSVEMALDDLDRSMHESGQ